MTRIAPLRFAPVFIHKPWGGRTLEKFKGELPEGDIGETWDVSSHPQGDTVVTGGEHDGKPLSVVVDELGADLVGTLNVGRPFPVMIRYVSSRENLSIQLHPTEAHAHKKGEPSGKDEAWYILDAAPDAFVYAGLKPGTTRAQFQAAGADGSLSDLVVKRTVKPGDFIYIPAGTVHAICAGITLIEICEYSNTTYRLYDYGRDRGLDLEDGQEVVDVDAVAAPHRGLRTTGEGFDHSSLSLTQRFAVSHIDVDGSFAGRTEPTSFQILTCLTGQLELTTGSGASSLVAGQSALLAASTGAYSLTGTGTLLETHVPDLLVERERLADLLT
ncbi:class I mannose-6-phosphate isomerase [Microbacterium sp. LjRoot45]|uniref:type I phosphomannose isomerase catalytic subunit n=1 Tax=Microbacterium sp. LjRoot45 TaxID=3342329 RepID=UPI003ECD9184